MTGSIIAFDAHIDAWLNPDILSINNRGPVLAASKLTRAVENSDPRIRVSSIPLRAKEGTALILGVRLRIDGASGRPFVLGFNRVSLSPMSGAITGSRDARSYYDRRSLILFIYKRPTIWVCPKNGDERLMGLVALIWAVDCCLVLG